MTLIGEQEFPAELALHRKYAKSELLLDLVWTHFYITMEMALGLLDSGKFDPSNIPRDALVQASLLYDIGTYICDGFEFIPGQNLTGRPYVQHTIAGAWLLSKEGYPPSIIQAAYTHAKVGFTAQDVALYGLALPPADYSPQTPFLKLMSYTTKFHSKAPRFRTSQEILDALQKYGSKQVLTFQEWQETYGEPVVTALEEKYQEWHLGMKYQLEQLRRPQGSTELKV